MMKIYGISDDFVSVVIPDDAMEFQRVSEESK